MSTRGTPCMPSEARSCKGTQNKLISWETEVFWDPFCIAKLNELFDGTGVSLDRSAGPASLNGLTDGIPGMCRKQERVVVNREKRMRVMRYLARCSLLGGRGRAQGTEVVSVNRGPGIVP